MIIKYPAITINNYSVVEYFKRHQPVNNNPNTHLADMSNCRAYLLCTTRNAVDIFTLRSCEQAGVASHWCTCNGYEQLDRRSKTAINGSEFVVRQLNGLLAKYRASVRSGYVCSELSLSKTLSVRNRLDRQTGRTEYLFTVETLPGWSVFEVTVAGRGDSDGARFDQLGEISRINMYGFQSNCTDDWRLKKHCYCVKDDGRTSGGRGFRAV